MDVDRNNVGVTSKLCFNRQVHLVQWVHLAQWDPLASQVLQVPPGLKGHQDTGATEHIFTWGRNLWVSELGLKITKLVNCAYSHFEKRAFYVSQFDMFCFKSFKKL